MKKNKLKKKTQERVTTNTHKHENYNCTKGQFNFYTHTPHTVIPTFSTNLKQCQNTQNSMLLLYKGRPACIGEWNKIPCYKSYMEKYIFVISMTKIHQIQF